MLKPIHVEEEFKEFDNVYKRGEVYDQINRIIVTTYDHSYCLNRLFILYHNN